MIQTPLRRQAQFDGRIRFWAAAVNPRDGGTRYIRVVTLDLTTLDTVALPLRTISAA